MSSLILPERRRGLRERLARLHWPLIILLTMIAGAGVITLYSVAEGAWQPWAMRHGLRYVAALGLLIAVGLVPIRYWLGLAYPIYFAALLALIAVPFSILNFFLSGAGITICPLTVEVTTAMVTPSLYYIFTRKCNTVSG